MRYWPQSCLCHVKGRLDGKVALVTDGPSFMGVEVAAELARRGATVYIGSQSVNHFNIIKDNILRLYGQSGEREEYDFADEQVRKDLTPIKESQLIYTPIHLNSLKAVKSFAAEFMNKTKRLDFLINNAVMSHGPFSVTSDQYESTMAIGHLSHYLLTKELLPLLKKTQPGSRIASITSAEHYSGSFEKHGFFIDYNGFNSIKAFAQVKLANVVHTVILSQQLKGTAVIPFSVNPGYVLPNFGIFIPSLFGMFFKTPWEAGQAVLYTLMSPDIKSGEYYSNCIPTKPSKEAQNRKIIEFVTKESERLVKVGK